MHSVSRKGVEIETIYRIHSYCEHMVDICPCVKIMNDCQEMIELWLHVETNHGVSSGVCNMSLVL